MKLTYLLFILTNATLITMDRRKAISVGLFSIVVIMSCLYVFSGNNTFKNVRAESKMTSVDSKHERNAQKLVSDKPKSTIIAPEEIEVDDLDVSRQKEVIKEIPRKKSYPVNLLADFDALKSAADNGGIEAAVILGKTLQVCAFEPKTEDEYTLAISTHFRTPIAYADAGYKLCKGITQDHLKVSTFYLEKAAKAGDLEGKIELFSAHPWEVDEFSDEYFKSVEDPYIDALFERKIKYLEDAVLEGSIDAAVALGTSYRDNLSPTITGFDQRKAIINFELARLMDPDETLGIRYSLRHIIVETPVYIVDDAQREASRIFKEELAGKEFSYLEPE